MLFRSAQVPALPPTPAVLPLLRDCSMRGTQCWSQYQGRHYRQGRQCAQVPALPPTPAVLPLLRDCSMRGTQCWSQYQGRHYRRIGRQCRSCGSGRHLFRARVGRGLLDLIFPTEPKSSLTLHRTTLLCSRRIGAPPAPGLVLRCPLELLLHLLLRSPPMDDGTVLPLSHI